MKLTLPSGTGRAIVTFNSWNVQLIASGSSNDDCIFEMLAQGALIGQAQVQAQAPEEIEQSEGFVAAVHLTTAPQTVEVDYRALAGACTLGGIDSMSAQITN